MDRRVLARNGLMAALVAVALLRIAMTIIEDRPNSAESPAGPEVVSPVAPAGTTGEAPAAEGPSEQDVKNSTTLAEWLRINFGLPGYSKTTWYDLIDRIEIRGSSGTMFTSLYPDDEGITLAKSLCQVLLNQDVVSVDYVLVRDQNGFGMAACAK